MTRRVHQSCRRHSLLFAAGMSLAQIGWSAGAHAQSKADLAKARQLYRQGLTQEAAGDWTGALAAFQQVSRIKLTPQVRFHIARSKEHLGRLNEALGGYRLAEYEAQQEGKQAAGVLDQIRSARQALEKRIPKLVIRRGKGADAIRIELDGVVVGESQIGHPLNVDPGPHELLGALAGGGSFKRTVDAKEGKTQEVVLDVPQALREKAFVAPPAKKPSAVPPARKPSPPAPDEQPPPGPTQDHAAHVSSGGSALPWVIGGVGVASLAASGVFYILRNNAKKKLDNGCIGDKCPDTLQSTQDAGQRYSTLTGVALGVGVAGIGIGAVWLIAGGSSSKQGGDSAGRSVSVRVAAAPQSTGVSIGGRF